jgi:hypothetical protein
MNKSYNSDLNLFNFYSEAAVQNDRNKHLH